jgi:hypothetical protein
VSETGTARKIEGRSKTTRTKVSVNVTHGEEMIERGAMETIQRTNVHIERRGITKTRSTGGAHGGAMRMARMSTDEDDVRCLVMKGVGHVRSARQYHIARARLQGHDRENWSFWTARQCRLPRPIHTSHAVTTLGVLGVAAHPKSRRHSIHRSIKSSSLKHISSPSPPPPPRTLHAPNLSAHNTNTNTNNTINTICLAATSTGTTT